MIRPLRKLHRFTFYILAVLLPVIFIAGLAVRRPIPPSPSQPVVDQTGAARSASGEAGAPAASGEEAIDLNELRASGAPDPLIYWSREQPQGDQLSQDAVLLGALSNLQGASSVRPRDLLPPAARESDGYLIIYSLANRRIVSVRPWRKGGGQ